MGKSPHGFYGGFQLWLITGGRKKKHVVQNKKKLKLPRGEKNMRYYIIFYINIYICVCVCDVCVCVMCDVYIYIYM